MHWRTGRAYNPEVHVAQLNIGRLKAPIEDPMIDDFRNNLARINALADASPGFIWRLKDESGDATSIKPFGDELEIVNLSVWDVYWSSRFLSSPVRAPRDVREIAAQLGVHRTTALRMLQTLTAAGFVRRYDSGSYGVGFRLAGLAQAAFDQFDLRTVVHPYIVALSERTGQTIQFAVPQGDPHRLRRQDWPSRRASPEHHHWWIRGRAHRRGQQGNPGQPPAGANRRDHFRGHV